MGGIGDSVLFLPFEGIVQKTFTLCGCHQSGGLSSLCLGLCRSRRLLALGARSCGSKLVGEESEQPRVGCGKIWQRWQTVVFLLVCRCFGVCVIECLWRVQSVLGSRSCSFLVLSLAMMSHHGFCGEAAVV